MVAELPFYTSLSASKSIKNKNKKTLITITRKRTFMDLLTILSVLPDLLFKCFLSKERTNVVHLHFPILFCFQLTYQFQDFKLFSKLFKSFSKSPCKKNNNKKNKTLKPMFHLFPNCVLLPFLVVFCFHLFIDICHLFTFLISFVLPPLIY